MKRYINAIFICLFAMLLLPAFVIGFSPRERAASAFDNLVFLQAECLDFDANTVSYDTENPVYARGIKLTFSVSTQYCVFIVVKNGEEISRSAPYETEGGAAQYSVTMNGELIIKCYAADSQGALLPVYAEVNVRSDNAAPQQAAVSEMTEWTRRENGFAVQVVLGVDNGNSGVKKAEIAIDSGEGVEVRTIESPALNDYFTIYEPTTVHITVFDNAGNYSTKQYIYDKFDSTQPSAPQFVFTPNVAVGEGTNGYAREYLVTISYGEDADEPGNDGGSGIKPGSMRYTLNGEQFVYEGSFYLAEHRLFTLSAYYQDNAGNTSPVVSAEVNNLDRIAPSLSDIHLNIDLTKALPYTLSAICTDSHSGIDRIQVAGENYTFTKQMHNVYSASFDSLDKELLQITVFDNVGNYNTSSLIVPHFGTLDLEDMAEEYNTKFLALDGSQYNQAAWQNLLDLYGDLSLFFESADTTLSDFDIISAQIDSAITGAIKYKYFIHSVPPGINLNISYVADPADFPNMKKGDTVTLVMQKIDKDGIELDSLLFRAASLSGFDIAFANPFMAKFVYNDIDVAYVFDNGALVTIPVPMGYEERMFAIIDLDSQQKLETEVINNTVTFKLKKAGRYALVTEGAVKTDVSPPPSGVRVFGKILSWGAFFGTIGGVVAVTAGLVALLTLRYKKPYTRRIKPPKETEEE
ncbi:MAG: hypothetical protein PHC84_02675 [Clostridia bacterium]|nr:hypothetical protein [Clostridia bacterium]